MRKRKPTHPGRILKSHYLDPLHLSVSHVAQALGVSRKTLSQVINERGAVTPELALKLAKAFNTTAELWLNLQQAHTLWTIAHRSQEWKKVPILSDALVSV